MKLFEVSWEVCNKVGGIHTVITSKMLNAQKSFKEYFLIGPYFKDKADKVFVEEELPKEFEYLNNLEFKVRFGTWKTKGEPKVFLIEYKNLFGSVNDYKKYFWEHNEVDSLFCAYDFEEPMVFSWAVSRLLEEVSKQEKILTHFHEWMCGFAGLRLKNEGLNAKVIFTTHATLLGRSIASNFDLYKELKDIDDMQWARKLNVLDKHTAEKACAKYSDVFTTVSNITKKEAKILLKRDPLVTPNGIDVNNYKDFRCVLEDYFVNPLKDFIDYSTDLKSRPLVLFLSGRYEHKNKGVDLIIDGLDKIRSELTSKHKDVVFFFLLAMDNFALKKEFVKKKKDFHEGVKLQNNSAICTHECFLDIERDLKNKGFDNSGKLKIFVIPSYLDGYDGLFDKSYEEVVSFADLGVFPSFYEPWGYTPMESVCLGVPSITTNLSGYGDFMKKFDGKGVHIINRNNYEKAVEDFSMLVLDYAKLDDLDLLKKKIEARELYKKTSWDNLYKYYLKAYNS